MSTTEEDFAHVIPRSLDEAGKFLFWDLDVAGVAILGVLLGLGVNFPASGLLLGIGAAALYARFKRGNHGGMATHFMYWATGLPVPRDLPASHLRQLNG